MKKYFRLIAGALIILALDMKNKKHHLILLTIFSHYRWWQRWGEGRWEIGRKEIWRRERGRVKSYPKHCLESSNIPIKWCHESNAVKSEKNESTAELKVKKSVRTRGRALLLRGPHFGDLGLLSLLWWCWTFNSNIDKITKGLVYYELRQQKSRFFFHSLSGGLLVNWQ